MSSPFRKRKREEMFRNCIRWPIQNRSKHDQSCPFCTSSNHVKDYRNGASWPHLSLVLGGEESSLTPIFEGRDIWARNRPTVRTFRPAGIATCFAILLICNKYSFSLACKHAAVDSKSRINESKASSKKKKEKKAFNPHCHTYDQHRQKWRARDESMTASPSLCYNKGNSISSIIHIGELHQHHLNSTTGRLTTRVVIKIEMSGFTYSSRNDLEAGLKDGPIQPISGQARLFLEACRHFRYSLVLKRNQEKKEQTTRIVRACGLVVHAAHVFREGADQVQVVNMIEMGGCNYNASNDLEAGLKDGPVQRFSRWQQVRLFLKASHHFRYALVLKRYQEKREQTTKKVRVHALSILAAHVLKEGGDQVQGAGDHFLIQPDKLARLTRTNSGVHVLKQYGGKEVLVVKLKTNLDNGISGDDNLPERRIKFGSNEYPPRTSRRLRTCIWEALHDFNRIVLVIAVVGSVVIGSLEETKKLGWHDIFSLAIVAAIFILVTAISDYTQDDQFQHMIKEIRRNNIQSKEVIRAGHPVQVSIRDIVVGDVIPLKSGDEVPADGIYISAQSLAIDKSRITGESKIFHKDSTRPFLRSGWRVKDGSGTMLVTAVGKFTESGNLMANTNSKDAEKKTPLQVLLKEVATFMGAVGSLVAVEVAYVVWLRDYFTGDNLHGNHPIPGDTLEEVIKITLTAATIFVVAVPEVLLSSYNLILLSSMKKINADKALVRRPAAYETMAFCNNLICDKIAIAADEGGCKSGIKEAMKLYQSAGIKVHMVTNDNLQTAKAIAMECHILGSEASDENFIEGKVFCELSDSERERRADKILVMAESSPKDKLLLVQALRKIGKVVAVTGYVTDDAPALYEADIGLAMGIEGNEVVKELENSDIIIWDGNFASVEKVFRWGRSVHERVLKVMQQQLTVNVVAVTINCMATVYYRLIPLNAVQFVWVNIIIFALGPLALATEPPADHLMSRPPIDRRQPLIKYIPWMRLLLKVGYQIIALLVINFQAGNLLKIYGHDHDLATKVKNTMIFNTFVVCQISIEFGARKTGILDSPRNWVTSNSVFLGIVGIILVIQFIIIEYLGKAFFIVRLNWKEWQFSLTVGIVDLFFAMLLFLKHLVQGGHH